MKDIPGYEGLYAITESGEVWSYKSNKFLKPYTGTKYISENGRGYNRISYGLYKNNERRTEIAARLVALTYIPNPQNLPEVDHIDRDPTNNNVKNLRWVTRSENIKNRDNSFLTDIRRMATLERSKPVAQIDMKTNEVINTFASSCEAASVLFNDVSRNSLINRCANHKKKSAYGFRWEFI